MRTRTRIKIKQKTSFFRKFNSNNSNNRNNNKVKQAKITSLILWIITIILLIIHKKNQRILLSNYSNSYQIISVWQKKIKIQITRPRIKIRTKTSDFKHNNNWMRIFI